MSERSSTSTAENEFWLHFSFFFCILPQKRYVAQFPNRLGTHVTCNKIFSDHNQPDTCLKRKLHDFHAFSCFFVREFCAEVSCRKKVNQAGFGAASKSLRPTKYGYFLGLLCGPRHPLICNQPSWKYVTLRVRADCVKMTRMARCGLQRFYYILRR